MLTIKRAIPFLFLAFGIQGAAAESGYSIGAEYSEGDYGTGETTTSWYIPVGWHYSEGDVSASIIVPYVSISGSSQVALDGRPVAPSGAGGGGGGSTTRTATGLGDITLSGAYQLVSESDLSPFVGVTAKAKLATADADKGLGSGENDYTLQLEAAKGMLFAYAGYTQIGDTSTVDYNDVSFFGVALDLPLNDETTLGLEYFSEEAALDGIDGVTEATISFGGTLNSDYDYALYYTSGLSDSSADSVIGVNFSSPMN